MKYDYRLVLNLIERKAVEGQMGPVATALSNAIVASHLARSPRVDVIRAYVKDLQAIADSDQEIIKTHIAVSAVQIDGNGLPALAALPTSFAQAEWAVENRQSSIIALTNTAGMRTLNVWARVLSQAGVVALVAWNGGPYAVVPHGSVDPFFGTNPLAYAIPTEGDPIVGDLATSEIAYMDLMAARRTDEALPDRAGIDMIGAASTNASEVFVEPDSARLLPMGGGHKGSAVMLLIEYLTGAFVGGLMGHEASPTLVASEFGGIIIVIPDNLFRPTQAVREDVSRLADDIRRSTPVRRGHPVRLPGDLGVKLLRRAAVDGVEISEETAALLGISGTESDGR